MSYSPVDDFNVINNINLNQDHGCFTCSMETGIRVYNMEPLREKTHLDSPTVGSVSFCEMLNRTNLLAIVGGGKKQKFAENTVLLWDDSNQAFVAEFVFPTAVLNVRLRRDRLYAVLRDCIQVFGIPNGLNWLYTFQTGDNPKGLCQVSPFQSSERQLLVYPSHSEGSITIEDLSKKNPGQSSAPVTINAHRSRVECISLNHQGTLVATASVTGTLIRIFDTVQKTLLLELRRGSDSAVVYCINFSCNSEYLCASSDRGTIHIFALKNFSLNKTLRLPNWIPSGSYGQTQWAFTKFKIAQECKCQCAFGSDSSVYAVCVDGTFHKYVYTEGGSCNRESYDVFLNISDDGDL